MKLPSSLTTVTPFSKFLALFLFILFPLTGFYFGMSYEKNLQKEEKNLQLLSKQKTTPIIKQDETVNWKIYVNKKQDYEFKYPANIKLLEDKNKTILNHAISYKNYGDCDMSGRQDKVYETLDDFNVSFEVVSGVVKPEFEEEKINIGNLSGSRYTYGAEGCGIIKYTFPLGNKTLLIEKAQIQATTGINPQWTKEVLKVPGVITKEESAKIFNQVLSTFKFIDQVSPTPAKEAGMANPAAVYCIQQGGKSQIITASDGSQSGRCNFADGRTCDEWEYFRTKVCK